MNTVQEQGLALQFGVERSPAAVFKAIQNVRGWWSEEIKGNTANQGDEFDYAYQDMHRCKVRLIEVIPDKRIVWEVLENYFSFTEDKTEWVGTKVIFDIQRRGDKTELHFMHEGLVPEYECYDACVGGWSQYILQSLPKLIETGKGLPNSKETARTTHEVALRFNELAKEEKWFEIQDELFADDVKSVEPAGSVYMKYAEGKANVRRKAEDFVSQITDVHARSTSQPIISGHHFAVSRMVDITTEAFGRIQLNELMVYEVRDGKIVMEQFFY